MPKRETSLVYGKLTHPMKQLPLVVVVRMALEEEAGVVGDVVEATPAVALLALSLFR
jgi:hypothetical protein